LLLGPRQTGKTTQIQQLCQDYGGPNLTYTCQLPSVRQRLEQDPEVLVREVEALINQLPEKQRILVWIDEIQKVPLVMDVLQFLLDQQKIILIGSGSPARSMRRLGVNWLPCRIMMEYAYPLSYWEVNAS
jgi:predicted AAA+ superfamily ATPase